MRIKGISKPVGQVLDPERSVPSAPTGDFSSLMSALLRWSASTSIEQMSSSWKDVSAAFGRVASTLESSVAARTELNVAGFGGILHGISQRGPVVPLGHHPSVKYPYFFQRKDAPDRHARMLFNGRVYVKVFSEDEALRHDPDATRVGHAIRAYLGLEMPDMSIVCDCGDSFLRAPPHLDYLISETVCGDELYISPTRLPYAVSLHEVAAFTRVASIRQHYESALAHPLPRAIEASGREHLALLSALGGLFQNDQPLTADDVARAIHDVDILISSFPNENWSEPDVGYVGLMGVVTYDLDRVRRLLVAMRKSILDTVLDPGLFTLYFDTQGPVSARKS